MFAAPCPLAAARVNFHGPPRSTPESYSPPPRSAAARAAELLNADPKTLRHRTFAEPILASTTASRSLPLLQGTSTLPRASLTPVARDSELERFRVDIDLRASAADRGYALDTTNTTK